MSEKFRKTWKKGKIILKVLMSSIINQRINNWKLIGQLNCASNY
jgi:hypothetical protein